MTPYRGPGPRALQLVAFTALLCASALAGCDRRDSIQEIELPETPIVTVRDKWAVVIGPYVRVRSEPVVGAAIRDYARRGLVVEVADVSTTRSADEPAPWLRVEGAGVAGWVWHEDLALYQTRQRAENAARQLSQSSTPQDNSREDDQ